MSEIQTIKTAIHEIAHAKLHAVTPGEKVAPEDKKDRRTKEVEAESIAYTVCQRYGIETSDYSFGYIAGWSSDKETKELIRQGDQGAERLAGNHPQNGG